MRKFQQDLYRDPSRGKVAGVCAGIAESFGFETWLVRVAAITMILLSGGMLFFVLYIAAWFILDVKPGSEKKHNKHRRNSRRGYQAAYQDGYQQEQPRQSQQHQTDQKDIDNHIRSHFKSPVSVKEKIWQSGELPAQAFKDISSQFSDLEKRLQNLETYVTSTEYTVANEINRL
ncbi:MAG: envelope stress response membrane protein PspC [Psychrosphaera sp.]|nr:envelope stress response membrane protein PspC [Psychrosphaera sp.]